MEKFTIHTIETAPEDSKEILTDALKQNGFIPNLYGIMAEAPLLLKAYTQIGQTFSETSFSSIEKNIIWLSINYTNACHYCMTIHSIIAKMSKVPDDIIEALRTNNPINDTRFESLRKFCVLLIEKRGWASPEEINNFLDAGYSKKHVLELLIGVGQKIMSNYVNHIAETPYDEKALAFKWEPADNKN